ncbi:hypothetical protein CLU79DRAFT_774122 [Phycomyces nitens]|nr:hypothetical protein CLU79DRAFT_774122 [Phycomyces nitens]
MSYSDRRFNQADYPYVIGIDFGTTYSGCSYIYTTNGTDEVVEITEWPKQRGAIYPKVPTACLYEADTKRIIAWGNDAIFKSQRPNTKDILIERFKLALDPNIATQASLPNGLTALEVITDYLSAFHGYILEHLERNLGSIYQHSKSRYCLTVPAMWDDYAKSTMREAAILAGIVSRDDHPSRLVLTSEPEAASLFCEKKCEQFKLEEGRRFMICDAGGGTVDLIVFEIDESTGNKSLREITKGSGASCGSTFLDARMKNIFKKRFGAHAENNKIAINHMMKQFITVIKPQFEDEDDEFFSIPMSVKLSPSDTADVGIEDGKLQVTVDDIREQVFEPVVKQVLDLISEQISQSRKKLDAIFLVGGFGQSKYLQRRVKETFIKQVGLIAMPPRGELAVVRGAVFFGLSPERVSHRVARRTYGLSMDSPFDPLLDPEKYKTITYEGNVMCKHRFIVYVKKGQTIETNECVSRGAYAYYPNSLSSDLYVFDSDGPPPRYVTDPRVRKVSHFRTEMPCIQYAVPRQRINVDLNMYFGHTEILLELIVDGKTFTSVSDFISHEIEKIVAPPIDTEQEDDDSDDNDGLPEYSFI